MKEDRILTLHPDPDKSGVRIERGKCTLVRDALLQSLSRHGEQTYTELANRLKEELKGSFQGSISWYVTVVKLDLEARGEIERGPKTRPQKVRLASR